MKMTKIFLITVTMIVYSSFVFGQNGSIKGQLLDYKTSKPVNDKPVILFGLHMVSLQIKKVNLNLLILI